MSSLSGRMQGRRQEVKMSRLWYRQPATVWEEALPLGNGRMGAMVFGGVEQERIQVNEESMWYGGEVDRLNPDAYGSLEEIRGCIFRGEIQKAQKLLDRDVAGCPDSMHPYQTLGDIRLNFSGVKSWEGYERELDLETAVCRTGFVSGGVKHTREAFLSHPKDCMVMRFTADRPGSVSFEASLSRGRFFDGIGRIGDNGICLYGNLGKGGLDFLSCIRAWAVGGTVKQHGQTLCVENADSVLLIFYAATSDQEGSGDGQAERNRPILEKAREKTDQAAALAYEELLAEHIQDYRGLYARLRFALKGAEGCDGIPTDERLKKAAEGPADLGLSCLLLDYGRYLMIACSRAEGLPATLQGIWNQEFLPPWDSKYTININMEMNYWIAENGNLSECHMPLFRLLQKMQPSGHRAAKEMYHCRGFMAHHNTDSRGDCMPQDTCYSSTYWVMGGAWLSTHIWERYEYTKDVGFLKEFYPIISEAALFFLDYLVEKDGFLVTCPSSSPENSYRLPNGETGAVTYGATMDNQILRDLFGNCLKGAQVLEEAGEKAPDAEFLQQVKEAREKLIPNRIGSKGTVMEWVEEYEECEPGHRHISHLYGLHPSEQITMDKTPELAAAARKTLESRLSHGGGHTGWSRSWIMNHYAKLWDGQKAYENLEQLLAISTYPNLFDRHPPFQIDGNFGAAAAIVNMLVQSTAERIVLLPALPDQWESGSISGVRVKGNAAVTLEWAGHKLTKCVISADSDLSTRLCYQGKVREINILRGQSICFGTEELTECAE